MMNANAGSRLQTTKVTKAGWCVGLMPACITDSGMPISTDDFGIPF